MFAPVGEYWFGYPHDSASDIQRNEPAVLDNEHDVPTNPEDLLKDAEDVKVSVMIIMPSSEKRIYHGSWGHSGDKGKRTSQSSSQSRGGQQMDENDSQLHFGIVETSVTNHGADRHEQEAEELPELVLGVAAVALRPPPAITSLGKEMEASASRPSAAIESPSPPVPNSSLSAHPWTL
jgi:hypothetical protein